MPRRLLRDGLVTERLMPRRLLRDGLIKERVYAAPAAA
jgi:hypothetical protein